MLIPRGLLSEAPEPRTLEEAKADIAERETQALAALKARVTTRITAKVRSAQS
jgi:hypothetical protein